MPCSNTIFNDSCQYCETCFNNCNACPNDVCAKRTMYFDNRDRINKQVRMDSSEFFLRKRTLYVSKQVGQSANPNILLQAGGPGDLIHGVQKTSKDQTYRLPIHRTRVANKGSVGVDKKHGSYARYLSRRIGGELRKEKMPLVRNKTAYIHQPRNRTGTQAACFNKKGCGTLGYSAPSKFLTHTRTAFKCNDKESQDALDSSIPNTITYPSATGSTILFGPYPLNNDTSCCSKQCCENRIPTKCDPDKKYSGCLGNNTQCVPSGSCTCCSTT